MGELESLLLVLVVIYVAECIVWVRRGSVLFINWSGLARTRWRLLHPGSTLGNQHGAILFANPLPPLGAIVFGQQPPVSLSGEAAIAFSAACLNPTWRPAQSARLVRFDEIKTIERDGRKIFVNGEVFLKAMSPFSAREVARQLRELKDASPARRAALLRDFVSASFDEKAVRARLDDFAQRSRVLRTLANSLFVFLYVLAPVVVWKFGLVKTVWPLVTVLLAHTVTIAILFRRAHGHLYPHGHEERFTPFLTMLLAPPSAVRSVDVLGKHLLEEFHALAAAKVLLSAESFRAFARRVLLDLRFPIFPMHPSNDALVASTENSFRDLMRAEAEKLVTRAGLKVEELILPPARSEAIHTAFCPRCDSQFVRADSGCGDCGGRPLARWN
jgi:hypothetical protein